MRVCIETLGEDALLLRIGDRIDAALNQQVHALAARILHQRPAWLRDLVPAYASLGLFVDGDAFDAAVDPLLEAQRWLRQQAFIDDENNIAAERGDHNPGDRCDKQLIEIPVVYGGREGPDLDDVAAMTGLTSHEVIQRHCASEYRVAMLGFSPGFPYLLGLDPALAAARMETPRLKVPAESVGIGGAQTGIYPREGPGGWRIIGRTAQTLFDPVRTPPALLAPGDRLRFVDVTGKAAP